MYKPQETPRFAVTIEQWLAQQNGGYTWQQIIVEMELDVTFEAIRPALKWLIARHRVRTISVGGTKEMHYQHIINDKDWHPMPAEVGEDIDPCPSGECHIIDDGGRCFKCPVFTGQVKHWTEVPDYIQYSENYCQECKEPIKLEKLGTTEMLFCPTCGWDNRPDSDPDEPYAPLLIPLAEEGEYPEELEDLGDYDPSPQVPFEGDSEENKE